MLSIFNIIFIFIVLMFVIMYLLCIFIDAISLLNAAFYPAIRSFFYDASNAGDDGFRIIEELFLVLWEIVRK
jgi:hypothetical protein